METFFRITNSFKFRGITCWPEMTTTEKLQCKQIYRVGPQYTRRAFVSHGKTQNLTASHLYRISTNLYERSSTHRRTVFITHSTLQ